MERMVRDGGAKARRWCCVRWCARKFDGTAEKTEARMEEDGGVLREWPRKWSTRFVVELRRVDGGGRGRRWWREEDGGAMVVGARTVAAGDGGSGCHGDGRW